MLRNCFRFHFHVQVFSLDPTSHTCLTSSTSTNTNLNQTDCYHFHVFHSTNAHCQHREDCSGGVPCSFFYFHFLRDCVLASRGRILANCFYVVGLPFAGRTGRVRFWFRIAEPYLDHHHHCFL